MTTYTAIAIEAYPEAWRAAKSGFLPGRAVIWQTVARNWTHAYLLAGMECPVGCALVAVRTAREGDECGSA